MKKKPKSGFSKFLRGGLILLEIAVLLPVLALLVSNQVIRVSSEAHLYDSLDELPYHHVGLVLGTSHRVRNGGPNPYFHNRMAAAADLYHSGKVRYLIVSGDNRTPYYNEPRVMRNAWSTWAFREKTSIRTMQDCAHWIQWCVPGMFSARTASPLFRNDFITSGPSTLPGTMGWKWLPTMPETYLITTATGRA